MTTKLEQAARQALEALEEAHTVIEHRQDVRKREEAITALREALAQPQGKWVDLTEDDISDTYAIWWRQKHVFGSFVHAAIAKFKEKNTPKVVQPAANVEQAWSEFHDWFEAGGETGWSVSDATHFRIMFGHGFHAALKCTTPPVVPQCEPVGCMVKGRLLSFKDNGIPDDCLLYLAPPSVEAAIDWSNLDFQCHALQQIGANWYDGRVRNQWIADTCHEMKKHIAAAIRSMR